jgi:hypothetical protein
MFRKFIVLVFAIVLAACVHEKIPQGPQEVKTFSFPDPGRMFTTSSTCARCHDNLKDVNGDDVSIYSEWKQSVHSNAATDLYFLAKVSSEVEEFPELKTEIEGECARCHMPLATVQAKTEGGEIGIIGVFLNPENEFHDFAIEGVSCTICHQIQDVNLGDEISFSGHYVVDTKASKPDRPIYGPYIPVWGDVMIRASGYFPVQGKHVRKAELCAICHTLYTPTIDNGRVVGSFPEQTPFLEWLNSIYVQNKTCQDCHMKPAKARITTRPHMVPVREMMRHVFAGANVQLLKMEGDYSGAERSLNQLKSAAKIKIESIESQNGKTVVKVRVENLAGHKFPTGFPSRRVWIHLIAYDSEGNVIFESGGYDTDGRISGEDTPYEPHYDVVDSPEKVQIYESVMGDTSGNVTRVLLKASEYLKDNRILPKGFDKNSAHPDTRVVGKAEDDSNFQAGGDVVTYVITGDVSRVRAELLYQPVSYPFVQILSPTDLTDEFLKSFSKVSKVTLVSYDEKYLD